MGPVILVGLLSVLAHSHEDAPGNRDFAPPTA
jgi:hypothetical protein